MRLTRYAVALAAGCCATAAQANALLDVYQQALANDKTFQAAQFQRDAALQAKPLAMANLLPQIGAQASYTQNNTSGTDASSSGSGSSSGNNTDVETKTSAYGVSLTQSIFDWSAIQKLRQSTDQVALAETGYRASQQDLILRVATAYFNVLAAADTLRFSQAENQAVGRQLEQSKQRFEVGLSAITDVQEAQARYDLTVASLINAETALSSARRVLAETTGGTDNASGAVPEDMPLAGPDPQTPATWIEAARKDNLSVLAARLQAEIAKKDIQIAQAGHLPTLSLQGSYSNSDSDVDYSGVGTFPRDSEGTSIGVVAKLPLFAGGAVRAGVKAASSTSSQRQAQLESATRTAERQTGDAYQGVLSGIARVKAYKQAVISSKTALEASEVGLQVGARTSIDVLNAQQQLYSAERDYARARYDYLLSVLQLKAYAGRLVEADLAEIDRLLVGG
ncbi:TolC family outer membrane protein [Stagnimonas aquatica]|nr:TolC family outer membrane protein [Stagnimonas aquatica]